MVDYLKLQTGDYVLEETGDKIVLEGVPAVTTSSPSSIGLTSALGNGAITGIGVDNPTIRGFQYNTVPIVDKTVSEVSTFAVDAFQLTLSGLTPGQTYYYRAFATNSYGTGYGSWVSFVAANSEYAITIGGIDRTTDVLNQTIQIDDILNDQQNTCSFRLIDRSGNGIPNTDDAISIVLPDGTKIFGGYVQKVTIGSKHDTGKVAATIECIDQVYLLDRNLVVKTYTSMTDKAIIEDIINTYCAGFGITTDNVLTGVTINQINFNYIQPSQAIRRIADLTGRNWYIDYDKDVHYFPLTTTTAPFNLADSFGTTRTTYISDPLTSTPSGNLKNNAAYVSSGQYVRLTSANTFEKGQLEYTNALASNFTIEFDFYVTGAGGGADATFCYWGAGSTPNQEDEGAGYGGYLLAYDEYTDQIQLWFNGTLLTQVAQTGLDNAATRLAKIIVTGSNIKVYLDGVLKIDYTDTGRTLGGSLVGIAGRTGAVVNEHRVSRVLVYTDVTQTEATDYANLQITKDGSQLKNRVYVRGGTKLSDSTAYEEKGDGTKKKFVLPDKPHTVTVKVNGVTKTLGIKNVDTTGYDWYLNFQEKYVEQDAGGVVLTSTDTLRVEYSYDIPILVAVEDTASITANGQREFPIFDKTITTEQAARDRASAELTDYANDIIEGSFTSYTNGFRSGQYINVNLADYGVNANYIVQSVTARSMGGGKYKYQINLASAKTMGIIRFLIELLEANNKLVEVNDQEVVDNLLSIADTLNSDSLQENLTIDSAGPYATWCTDSTQSSPTTRARWDLFQWG